MPDFAVRTSFTATDKLSPAFRIMGAASDKFASRTQKSFMRAGGSANFLRGAMGSLMPFFGVAAIARVANDAINLASALNEVSNVVDITFGKEGAKNINAWADTTISKFGVSELKAKQFSSTFGAMAKSSGIAGDDLLMMSKRVSELAGDLVSFRDLENVDVAFEKLQSIVTGTTQPLRELGLNMTVANLSAFALSKNITKSWKNMSQAEQIMLRYNYVMENTKDAQGDFARTLNESYANQKKVLSTQFDQFLAKIAIRFLPPLIEMFKTFNAILASIDTNKVANGLSVLIEVVKYLVFWFVAYKVALMATAFWQWAIAASGVVKGFMMIAKATNIMTAAQWLLNLAMSANPIGLVVLGITALIAGFMLLVSKTGGITEAFMVIGKVILKVLLMPINLVLYAIRGILFLASKLPGIGGAAAEALAKVSEVQGKMNNLTSINEFDKKAPNESQVAANNNNVSVNINNKNVESDVSVAPKRNASINYASVGAL